MDLSELYQKVYEGAKKADKDYDGDGKVESGTDEYMGSRDKHQGGNEEEKGLGSTH